MSRFNFFYTVFPINELTILDAAIIIAVCSCLGLCAFAIISGNMLNNRPADPIIQIRHAI